MQGYSKPANKTSKLSEIRMLVLDVDGVLTDGTIVVDEEGKESKFFNVLDGHGIRMWRCAGLLVAFLSGRRSGPTKQQAAELGVEYCLEDCHDKLASLRELLRQAGLSMEQVAYVGDDLPDLPAIRCAGFGAAVAGAADELKRYADFVTTRAGGEGAVREVIEHILRQAGKWDEVMSRYLADLPQEADGCAEGR